MIYAAARAAGFSPDQSATMTAVALAESGGNTGSHNPNGEDSRGLWQINVRAHPGLGQQFPNLYDPVQNARAAFVVSGGGSDISPWTTTHNGLAAKYLRYRSDAEQAAVAYGDGPGHGMWTGTAAYGDHVAAGPTTGAGVGVHQVADQTGSVGPDGATVTAGGTSVAGDGTDAAGTASTELAASVGVPGGDGSAGTTRPGEEYGIPLDDHAAHTVSANDGPRPGEEYGIPLTGTSAPATLSAQTGPAPETTAAQPPAPEATPPAADGPAAGGGDAARLQEFLNVAVAQTGDQYVWGAHADFNNPHPSAFDCSDLVQWATHRVGITDMPRTAWEQYEFLHHDGHAIPIDKAIHTPGALLFSFSSDPDSGHPAHCHVAISLGDGKTMEAKGTQYGVGSWDANTKRFQYAAVIPGLSADGGATGAPTPTPTAQPTAGTTADIVDQFAFRLHTDPSTMDSQPAMLSASEQLTAAQPDPPHHDPTAGLVADVHHDGTDSALTHDPVDYTDDAVDGIGHDGTDSALSHATQWSGVLEPPDHHDPGHADHIDHHDGSGAM